MCIIYTVREVQISIHALREEGDICFRVSNPLYVNFYPRPPRGGRPISTTASTELLRHFYPRPPRGGRPLSSPSRYPHQYFYPRPPRGGRQTRFYPDKPLCFDFYPRPPRGGRPKQLLLDDPESGISIHALREEGDSEIYNAMGETGAISIHALRKEGDRRGDSPAVEHQKFLSTPSARRATLRQQRGAGRNPRVSIHALREEGDVCVRARPAAKSGFLSTPSARRATNIQLARHFRVKISIHALREEGDYLYVSGTACAIYFYPRPPRGGRPLPPGVLAPPFAFLSTPSARRATWYMVVIIR